METSGLIRWVACAFALVTIWAIRNKSCKAGPGDPGLSCLCGCLILLILACLVVLVLAANCMR